MSTTYRDLAGRKPQSNSEGGGYAYAGENVFNHNGHTGGWEAGFGVTTGTLGDEHGAWFRDDMFTGQGFFGGSSDGNIGAAGNVRTARLAGGWGQPGDGAYGSASVDAFGAGFDSWVNPDKGAAMGMGAYILQGDVSGGNIGSGARDEEARFGLGAGVGAAGRLHWGDADNDGRREYGFGADIGPVSFDIKTEDPLLTLAKGSPLAPLAWGADWLMGDDFNLTESVGNGLSAAGGAIADGAGWLADTASDVGGAIWDGAGAAVSFVGSLMPSLW